MAFEIIELKPTDAGQEQQWIFEPYKPRLPESSPCSNCFAACCRAGVKIALSKKEARRLSKEGTKLRRIPQSELQAKEEAVRERHPDFPGISAGYAGLITKRYLFELESDCGFLDTETNMCKAVNSRKRPSLCYEFEASPSVCATLKDNMLQRMLESLPDATAPISTEGV